MDDASNSTFKWKNFKNNKKENFNTLMSREMESITWKVKNAWEKYVENPLEWMKNHEWARRECPFSLELSIMLKWKSLYMGDVLPKKAFSLPHFPT